MNTDDQIHQELMRYLESKHKVSADILISDPSFQDMDVDSFKSESERISTIKKTIYVPLRLVNFVV